MQPLESVFNSKTEEVEETGEQVEVEAEVEARAEVEAQAETEVETKESESSPPEDKVQKQLDELQNQVKAFQAKAQDEVRKRQALENQAEKADAYVEPDKAIQQAVDEARNETWSAIRLMQENAVREKHADYDEKFTIFEQLAQNNPTLLAQANNEFDPAAFIYKTASNHAKLESVGDLDTYEERIRADERAKLEAEFGIKQKELVEKTINDAIPQTLSGATAAGGTGGKVYTGPTPLKKILDK